MTDQLSIDDAKALAHDMLRASLANSTTSVNAPNGLLLAMLSDTKQAIATGAESLHFVENVEKAFKLTNDLSNSIGAGRPGWSTEEFAVMAAGIVWGSTFESSMDRDKKFELFADFVFNTNDDQNIFGMTPETVFQCAEYVVNAVKGKNDFEMKQRPTNDEDIIMMAIWSTGCLMGDFLKSSDDLSAALEELL